MIIEINILLCEQLISVIIMGCPGGKINMAAVCEKRSVDEMAFSEVFFQRYTVVFVFR